MSDKLMAGDTFPELKLRFSGGRSMSLPGDIDSDYLVLLFYRGHW